jgi:hypothetical protein
MEQKIEKALEAINDLVNDETPWTKKVVAIEATVKANPQWETALEEFTSWFDNEEEDEEEDEEEEKG